MRGLLVCILFFSIFITTFHLGFFSWAGFGVLLGLLSMLFLLFFFRSETLIHAKELLISFSPLSFVLFFTLSLFGSTGIYQTVFFPSFLLSLLPILLTPLVLSFLLSPPLSKTLEKARLFFLFFGALCFRFLVIIASPKPIIDVFTILKEAPFAFLSGANPYDMVYSPVYQGVTTNYFAYFPASFLLQIPFVFLFGDPRVLLIICDIGSAFLLYLLGKKTEQAQLFALIYLFRPNALFIIEQSWLTPLVFFLAILSYYFLQERKEILAGVTLGILTAVQPLYSIVGLFFLFIIKNIPRVVLSFVITVSILILPFFWWNKEKFIEKTILVYFKPLASIPTIPVHLSLNLNTAFFTLTGNDISFVTLLSLLLVITFCIVTRLFFLYQKKDRHMISYLLLSLVLFFYSFYFLFRQSFINYYYLVTGFLILWFVHLVSMR